MKLLDSENRSDLALLCPHYPTIGTWLDVLDSLCSRANGVSVATWDELPVGAPEFHTTEATATTCRTDGVTDVWFLKTPRTFGSFVWIPTVEMFLGMPYHRACDFRSILASHPNTAIVCILNTRTFAVDCDGILKRDESSRMDIYVR